MRPPFLLSVCLAVSAFAGPAPLALPQEPPSSDERPVTREGEPHEEPRGRWEAPEKQPELSAAEIDEELLAAEDTVRQILVSLTIELDSLRARIGRLSERVRILTARVSPDLVREGDPHPTEELIEVRPRPLSEDTRESGDLPRRMPSPWIEEGEEALMYESLLERQRSLISRWRILGSRRPEEGPLSEEQQERRSAERAKIRQELQRVLAGILDLRERGRRSRLEKLRRELDVIERELDVRRDEQVRRKLVESRLEELLEGHR